MTEAATIEHNDTGLKLADVIAPFIVEIETSRQNYECAKKEIRNAQETIERFSKAVDAAEAEGKAISPQIRDIYRNGGSVKDAVKLKAIQREAFENAEIMRSLLEEGKVALARAELNVHLAASDYRGHADRASKAAEEYLFKHLSEFLPNEVWLYMDLVAFHASHGTKPEYDHRQDIHTPEDFALNEFGRFMSLAYKQRDRESTVCSFLPLPPAGISSYGKSPIKISLLKREVEQQEASVGYAQ